VGIESVDRIERVAAEWDELADRACAAPWLRPGWVGAWRNAFGRGRLELMTLRRDGRLAAVLPLERRFGTLQSTTNWHTPAFVFLAEDAAAAQELAHALFGRGGRRVALAFLAPDDRTLRDCFVAANTARYRLKVRTLERSPYVVVDGDWEAYESRRDPKLRRELRRRRRRLGEQGRLTLEVMDGSERLDELLEEGFRIEAVAWKGERGTAIVSGPDTRRFYGELARWASARGWLRLAFLRLDDRPLAFDYCLEDQGVHALLKTGYDPAYRAYAPGMLLRQDMIARAFSLGLARYDFLGNDERWKLVWADAVHELSLLEAFAPSAPGLAYWAVFVFARSLAKRALVWRGG
jgi:CelD/BcsL family acetyltransferase involved in cellulose biosynthesis